MIENIAAFIKNQRKNHGVVTRDIIDNDSNSEEKIAKAKARVQKLINDGELRRKRVKRRNKKEAKQCES